MMKNLAPLTDAFIRNGIFQGWLVPPPNENGFTLVERLLAGVIRLVDMPGVIARVVKDRLVAAIRGH